MKRVLLFVMAVLCLWACDNKPEEIAVTSVSLSHPTAEMIIGETLQLQVSISPSNATDKTVIWASSKQSVATVSNTGLVSAIAEGTSAITVSAGGKSATCTVTVSKKVIEVSSVKLNKESLELVEGDSETLIATVLPENATDKTVTWESSDPSVASVDQSGTVTAVAEGQAGITAMIGDKGSFCKVVVSKKVIVVESIELDKTELTLYEGETETLVATVKPDNATDKTVTWSSSNTEIAAVDNTGTVIAIKDGSTLIIAKAGDQEASCKVNVRGYLPSPNIVDLGLSVCWASFNLGATQPEEYGNYYAWGEVNTKDTYTWDNYLWCDGSLYSMKKYNQDSRFGIVDNKTVLELEDDAAYANLGPLWRMPTIEECSEYVINCKRENRTVNGINGTIITSKINGNSIFLPSAGYDRSVGDSQNYWTSSLDVGYNAFSFGASGYGDFTRASGLPIRPVFGELTLNPTFIELQSESKVISFMVTSHLDFDIIPECDWLHVTKPFDSIIELLVDNNNTGKLREGKVRISLANGAGERHFIVFQAKEYTFEAEAIDMGLSVKWSSTNLGASSPEDYGAYYSWGEIEPKVYFSETERYKWYDVKTFGITKYNATDGKTVLDSEDDAAQIKLGGKWRIPTREECIELVDNCAWSVVSRNGTNGVVFTSKINGNTLFFPFSGSFFSQYNDIGENGFVWASDGNVGMPILAKSLSIHSGEQPNGDATLLRYMAVPIRPVTE